MSKKKKVSKPHISKHIKHESKLDYIAGLSADQIGEKYNVNVETVKTWIRRYGWNKEKERAQKEAEESLYEKYRVSVMQISETILSGTRLACQMAGKALAEILAEEQAKEKDVDKDGNRKRSEFNKRLTKIRSVMKIFSESANTIKTVIPSASEDLSEQILEELVKLQEGRERGVLREAI